MWSRLTCNTLDAIDFDDSNNRIFGAISHRGRLYFRQSRRISVWDPSDPENVRHLGDHPIDPSGESWLRGDEWWFCNGGSFGSPGIEVVNLETMTSRRMSEAPIKAAMPEKKVGDPGSGRGLSGFRLVHLVGDTLLIYTMERVLVFRRT